MVWRVLGHWEWIVIELLVLGLAFYELISIRRTRNRLDRKKPEAPP